MAVSATATTERPHNDARRLLTLVQSTSDESRCSSPQRRDHHHQCHRRSVLLDIWSVRHVRSTFVNRIIFHPVNRRNIDFTTPSRRYHVNGTNNRLLTPEAAATIDLTSNVPKRFHGDDCLRNVASMHTAY